MILVIREIRGWLSRLFPLQSLRLGVRPAV
jgi:hypothetical protein